MADMQEILSGLSDRFDAGAAAGLNIVFQFNITDGDPFHIDVNDGTCDIVEGTSNNPSVSLISDTDTFVGIMTGEVNGMQAFMTGKLRTEGNMMLASKLGELFKQ
ncbi:SCP2 sterol-binding domain-containing protein [Endozoicomonas lisbonensis]|uniref:Sterol carrier protein n=1 Tax=Endozoicomonas lisbonensis TaxID=3120522 RepID=A0ABV2SJV8_9GAMM